MLVWWPDDPRLREQEARKPAPSLRPRDEPAAKLRRNHEALALRRQGLKLREIAERLGLSVERVRQIVRRAERREETAARNARVVAEFMAGPVFDRRFGVAEAVRLKATLERIVVLVEQRR